MPLERTVTEEGSAYGAALLGGVAAGVFADLDDAVARCVRVADRVEPDPEWAAVYAAGYERFRRGYPAVRPL
jgi:xylulokinase